MTNEQKTEAPERFYLWQNGGMIRCIRKTIWVVEDGVGWWITNTQTRFLGIPIWSETITQQDVPRTRTND